MIKVLSSDDEPKIRRGIASCIDWESLGMRVCAFAKDGKEAIEKVKAENPDVCLVDICMPKLDGLDLTREIHKHTPDAKCIVITGYDDFTYAKKAVSVGVYEYILKPVNQKELYDVLKKVAQVISSQKETTKKTELERDILSRNLSVLREHFLLELIEGKLTSDEIIKQSVFFGLALSDRLFALQIQIKSDGQADNWDETLLSFALKNIFEDVISQYTNEYVLFALYGKLCVIINDIGGDEVNKIVHQAKNVFMECSSHSLSIKIEQTGVDDIASAFKHFEKESGNELSEFIRNVKKHIDKEAFDSVFSVTELATEFNVNASHLSRQFKQEMSINNIEYITKVRMDRAVKLLEDTEAKVYEIADIVGYASQHYFCVAFKKCYGVSPTEFRSIIKKN